ncbi:MAG: sulfatase-like hydrolase/transferase [Polyangia bacterium]
MSRCWQQVLWAGLLGGVLAGGGDALATFATTLTRPSVSHALGLGIVAGALLGTGMALLAVILGVVAAALAARVHRISAGALVAVIMAAPLLTYDGFALFSGAKASRVAGHQAMSVVLVLLMLLLVGLAGGLWQRLLVYLQGRGGVAAAVGLGLVAAAAGAERANRVVLPRLYPWFHLSLGLFTVAACVLAMRSVLGSRAWRLRGGVALAASVLALAGLGAHELSALGESQNLRFFAHERTQVGSLALRLLPARRRPATAHPGLVWPSPASPLTEGPHRPGADVVLITVDATRADHVGAYGYGRPTTPNIDALAGRGVRFDRAYAQAPHTSFSIASLMTGKYYPTLARLAPHGQHETLALTLRRYGWKTAAFFPPAVFFIDAHKMKTFETSNFDFEYVKYEYLDANQRVGQIDDFFRKENPRRAFLWLHLFEPHEPYQVHPGYDFGSRDIDRYDSEIAYCDAVVGRVIAYLQKERPNAVIVVAADHGEEFDEHGGRYHGTTLYDEQVRVPLVIYVPGLPAHVVAGPVQLIDIAPTILGLLDMLAPARMRGTDLGPWLAAPPAPDDRLPPAFAELEDKRMVVKGKEKLICDLAKDYCAYYDLGSDPREEHNLAEARPERVAALRQLLDNWLDEQARFESKRLVGAETPGLSQAIERGRMGDAEAAPELAALLQSPAPVELRREAARLLVEALPARQDARPMVVAAMNAGDDEVRDWAAVAAARLGETASRSRLLAIVARPGSEANAELRRYAALSLAEAGDGTGVVVLGEALDACAGKEALCKSIIAALGKLRDVRPVPALIAHLPDVRTRLEVVQALGEIGDASAEPALVERLQTDEYVPVRVAAARALGRMGGARALMTLKWSASNDKEPRVVEAARAGLAELRRGP